MVKNFKVILILSQYKFLKSLFSARAWRKKKKLEVVVRQLGVARLHSP